MFIAHKTKFGFAMAAAIAICGTAPVAAQEGRVDNASLASADLAEGDAFKAIDALQAALRESPNDPALLINLGIAHAQLGDEANARKHFEAALSSREVIELDTADGRTTDSRRLARRAISMLERGEFRPTTRQSEQLTLRN